MRGRRARRGAILGFVFGLVYFAVLMSWLVPVTRLGWSLLILSQAAWMALLFAGTAAVWRADRPLRTAASFAAGWAAVEWVRGVLPLGGFTWGSLGATQHDNPLILPLASVLGAWGISFVVAGANVLVLAALEAVVAARVRPRWGSGARLLAAAAAISLLPALIPTAAPDGPAVDVAAVQGNVPEDVAFESRLIEDRIVAENHARAHLGLASDPPDLAVWPENALDQDPRRDPGLRALVEGAVRDVGAPTLIGVISREDDGLLRNEDFLYDSEGALVDRYVKNHLVPFGEYVPFRGLLEGRIEAIEQVRSDLTPGDAPGRFRIAGATFSSVICFENSFPDLVRQFTTADMGFIVVSTNNATFRRSPLAEQHLAMSELRAVENGRWVVHAAISGISAIVDSSGRVLERTELFEPAVLRARVPQGSGRTVFNLIGGWVPAGFVLGASLALAGTRRPRGRPVPPLPDEPRAAVILPTYNEAETIEEVVRGVLEAGDPAEVIVVDDGSPDGTADLVRGLGEERVTLVERGAKRGLADAYLEGFGRALATDHDLVVEMDADLSHDPGRLPALLEGARRHHLVIGSRYVPGGSVREWTLARRLLSRGGNLYARLLLGLPVADATSGFRVYRAEALRELLAGGVSSDGYAFQIELTHRAWRAGMSIGEVPITFIDRRAGRSKLSRGVVLEALWKVLVWGARHRLRPPG